MAKTIKEERLRWVLPIAQKEVRLVDVAKVCPYGKRSIERWAAAYRKHGENGLAPRSTEPKHCQGETPISIKERVIAIRKETKKCALKIHWQLRKEGIILHERTVGKILKKERLVRKYRAKKIAYKYIKAERLPGELIEIDVKHVPGPIQNKRYFQYTAIDTASRWRHLAVFDEQGGWNTCRFLEGVIRLFPHTIRAIKTDNHASFTNRCTGTYKRSDLMPKGIHAVDRFCNERNIIHYLIDPGKPAQNGAVERSHREDQEKFYEANRFRSVRDLQKKMRAWNTYYNNLEHCGLGGKTPNEFLAEYAKVNPPNVRT